MDFKIWRFVYLEENFRGFQAAEQHLWQKMLGGCLAWAAVRRCCLNGWTLTGMDLSWAGLGSPPGNPSCDSWAGCAGAEPSGAAWNIIYRSVQSIANAPAEPNLWRTIAHSYPPCFYLFLFLFFFGSLTTLKVHQVRERQGHLDFIMQLIQTVSWREVS